MHFEPELGNPVEVEDEFALYEALHSLSPDGSLFAVVLPGEDPGTYLQVAYVDGGRYRVEYQLGSLDRHFELPDTVTFGDLCRVARAYLQGDASFHGYPWKKMKLEHSTVRVESD